METVDQKEQLQQQKLKLQLQQQQIMQEHLQLQFDALNNKMATKENDNVIYESPLSDACLHSPTPAEKTSQFPDLSSGVLSVDGSTGIVPEFVNEAGMIKSSDDEARSELTHIDNSKINVTISASDFAPLPPVSSVTIFSSALQQSPLQFTQSTAATTAPSATKLTSAERAQVSPRTVNPTLHTANVYLQPGKPHLSTKPSLYLSSPHIEISTVSHSKEPKAPSELPTSQPFHNLAEKTSEHTSESTDQPFTAAVRFDDNDPFLSPSELPSSENTVLLEDQKRVVFSGGTSNFSTPFVNERPLSFQFPSVQGTDTASYLQYYQQQLLEQQNRIREQQKAIQERQQQRLEQLKQFQETLRGETRFTGLGITGQTGAKVVKYPGLLWQSLIPSTKQSRSEDMSTSTGHTQSEAESVDRASSGNVHPCVSPLRQQQLTPSKTTKAEPSESLSSSLSRYPSDIILGNDKDASVLPKTSELGLWSDNTPHISSSDATKSSSTTFDISNSDKKFQKTSLPELSNSTFSNTVNHGKLTYFFMIG